MLTVHKFKLEDVVRMPEFAQILSVDYQGEDIYIWALVNVHNPITDRKFKIYGTGWEVSSNDIYLCSLQNPPYVWHIFEVL